MSRCRGVVVTLYSSCSLPPSRNLGCLQKQRDPCPTAESNASNGPMHDLRPLIVISFLSPSPSPTTYNMSRAGRRCSCRACSAARAGWAVRSRAAPAPARRAAARGRAPRRRPRPGRVPAGPACAARRTRALLAARAELRGRAAGSGGCLASPPDRAGRAVASRPRPAAVAQRRCCYCRRSCSLCCQGYCWRCCCQGCCCSKAAGSLLV
jgi:hypothetical protein